MSRRAVFFDRDGVVNELALDPASGLPESPLAPEQVSLLPTAVEGLRRLRELGYVLVGVSNQPAAAKGAITRAELEGVQARVLELLHEGGVEPDGFRLCLHHPNGTVAGLSGLCSCRKPAPGMLLDAAAELALDLGSSWMVGDTDADVAAGNAAGCRTILIEHRASAHKRDGGTRPDATAPDLGAAAEAIAAAEAQAPQRSAPTG